LTGIFKEAVIGILAAVVKQERGHPSERTIAGLQRARAPARVGGRPKAEDDHMLVTTVRKLREEGASLRNIATKAEVAVNTVRRYWRRNFAREYATR
jgi:DNA invertase Pin-like site-specific DNA recombinase